MPGELTLALMEIERGLSYRKNSELNLLAAILCKRLSYFDQMRQYVAAIPVDDRLRSEAEWLVRSHQMRQRDLRERSKTQGQSRRIPAGGAQEAALPAALAAVRPSPTRTSPPGRQLRIALGSLLLLLVAGWLTVGQGAQTIGSLLFSPTPAPALGSVSENQPANQPAANPVEPSPGITPTVSLTTTNLLVPTSTPANVPANVAEAGPQAVAGNTTGAGVVPQATPYDLTPLLSQAGRAELAGINVTASLSGTVLLLSGIVATFEQQKALLDVVATAPGVSTVNQVDLLLRVPPTYTVQAGDTLWDITYRLYGNVDQMERLVAANADQLPSPSSLSVGMVLQIPANE